MSILGIDPGTTQSGYCHYGAGLVLATGVCSNEQMLAWLEAQTFRDATQVAIEMIASYGMPVGREVFETCLWIGEFRHACRGKVPVRLVYRRDVKLHLCASAKANDGNVRQALLDRFPRTGGGKTPQIGVKDRPGPLYGVNTHAWPALGVAIVADEVAA